MVIGLGLANWIATVIVVDSELFKPLRRWVDRRAERADGRRTGHAWYKARYLVSCHLCSGTWIGFALAAVAGGPIHGPFSIIVNGLIYKAIGHLALEVVALVISASLSLQGDDE